LNAPAPTAELALLVTRGPFSSRDARAELDVALAAAALDRRLELFFIGEGLLQLARERDAGPALLPPGARGWAALPELGAVRAFAPADDLRRCERLGIELVLTVEPLPATRFRDRWRRAAQALVL